MQMVERLSYWSVTLQMPIYIAQKNISGGLGFSHIDKGIIYFCWALVQNLTPLLSGPYADKIGKKKVFHFSFLIIISSFIFMGLSRTFELFLLSTLFLGFGLGSFKPVLQGAVATELNKENSSTGWAIYVLLINLSVFLAPPLSIYLKGINWHWLFFGSAILFFLNYLFLAIFKEKQIENKNHYFQNKLNLTVLWEHFKNPVIYRFVILMTGFTIVYMQFYETLPNFIFDWIDTSKIASFLHLPDYMLMTTPNGKMIAFEWLYNLNTGLIILLVVPLSLLTMKYKITRIISAGIFIASIGLGLCGFFYFGSLVLLGFIIYTIGEMIANPKFTEYLGKIAPIDLKSTYLSYLNISWAIGLAGGGLLGGFLYNNYGEKAMLARKYLIEVLHYRSNISVAESTSVLSNVLHKNQQEITYLIRDYFSPEIIWIPFIAIGLISSIGFFLSKIEQDY
jgi:MFS family permease